MKYLLLLRHGEAVSNAQEDRARALSAHGLEQARMIGAHLADKIYRPERVICSPARRTRQTWENVRDCMEEVSVSLRVDDALYNAMPGEIFDCIARDDAGVSSLMVIGHNPGLSMMAQILCDDQRLAQGFSPATLVVLSCAALEDWADIQPDSWELVDCLRPA